MGTSQSAIARMESAQENITLDTLQRLVVALDGRFYVSIQPRDFPPRTLHPWWEAKAHTFTLGDWNVKAMASGKIGNTDNLLLWCDRQNQPTTVTIQSFALLPGATLVGTSRADAASY